MMKHYKKISVFLLLPLLVLMSNCGVPRVKHYQKAYLCLELPVSVQDCVEHIQQKMVAITGPIPEADLYTKDKLHITLVTFPRDRIDEKKIQQLIDIVRHSVAYVKHFSLLKQCKKGHYEIFQTFGGLTYPVVVIDSAQLAMLVATIKQALDDAGIHSDRRFKQYKSHISLGRFAQRFDITPRQLQNVAPLEKMLKPCTSFDVKKIVLKEHGTNKNIATFELKK